MSKVDAPILVIGGGPVGMAMALGLARAGVRSIVIERRSRVSKQARAAGILPRTLEILAGWGVLGDFERRGLRQPELRAWHIGANCPALTLDLSELPTGLAYLLLLPQSQTEALLEHAALATGLVQVKRGHALVGIAQDAHRVRCKVEDLAANKTYHLYGRYAVGCDGYRSLVRKTLGVQMPGKTYGMRVVLADLQADPVHDTLPWPRFFYEDRSVQGAVRLGSGLWRTIATVPRHVGEDSVLNDAATLSRAQSLISDPVQNFRIQWKSIFKIHSRTATAFRRGRIFLAGDAAHVNSPLGGQGMNAGIADVHNLAWKLARALSQDGNAVALLDSYEAERRDAVLRQVQPLTDRFTRLLCLRLPDGLYRSVWRCMAWLMQRAWVRRRLLPKLAMLDTRYHRSPLFIGHHPLVGARAPDALLTDYAGRAAHFTLRHEGAALLLFEGRQKSRAASLLTAAAVTVKGVTFHRILQQDQPAITAAALCDTTGQFWQRWGAHPGMMALVRPDGHVGFVASQSPGSVEAACVMLRRCLGIKPAKYGRARPPRGHIARVAPGTFMPAMWYQQPKDDHGHRRCGLAHEHDRVVAGELARNRAVAAGQGIGEHPGER